MKVIEGGVTAAQGFLAAGLSAGIKKGNTKDMAMLYSKVPWEAAGTERGQDTGITDIQGLGRKFTETKWRENERYRSIQGLGE